ncbi:hypothetical protein SMF913_14562 [Streptomyces malaysiensis]|uniref:Uncharacterized protein n=1 Tax=Streptomyces malaysiensis TaxID=92644 RepID=A0A2J7ZE56_STRMQ|nr:hypothetical protein SMF913_14562 [Streptomyces malaysiensis]
MGLALDYGAMPLQRMLGDNIDFATWLMNVCPDYLIAKCVHQVLHPFIKEVSSRVDVVSDKKNCHAQPFDIGAT